MALTQSMVNEINNKHTTWKAEISTRFANATLLILNNFLELSFLEN